MIIQSAKTLDDVDETQKAREVISERFKIEENAFLKMYFTAKLYHIEYKEGIWDEAFLAQRKAVDMLQDGAADSVAGTDTGNYLLLQIRYKSWNESDEDMAGSWPRLLNLYILINQEGIERDLDFIESL